MTEEREKISIWDVFTGFAWPGVVIDRESSKIYFGEDVGYEENGKICSIKFYKYNRQERKIEKRYYYLEKIEFDKNLNIADFIYISDRDYKVSYYNELNNILGLSSNKIEKIEILKSHKALSIEVDNKIIKVSPKKFFEIIKDAKIAANRAKSYKNSISNYLCNKAAEKYGVRDTQETTNIEKGEFAFLVDRFNLKTKKKVDDFLKYLESNDIEKIEDLSEDLIRNKIFSESFLKRLDDYFIKEKLSIIIDIGKKILNLKTEDLQTEKAKEVLNLIGVNHDVGQLENVWQEYFKKYLLYLIFSYKKILSKVEFKNIDGDKKAPDFIGVNHYNGIDIIEIKTHLKPALISDIKSHGNYAFSGDLSKAIIQTMNYMDLLVQKKFKNQNKKEILSTCSGGEENLHHPRGIIIISSTDKLVSSKRGVDREKVIRDFTKLRNSINNIEIITFDEVLNVAENYIKNIVDKSEC